MKNKTIIATAIFFLIILFSSFSYAVNEIVGGVTGNVLNNTENMVENVANGVSEMAEDTVNGVTNAGETVSNTMENGMNTVRNYTDYMTDDDLTSTTTNEYNATTVDTAAEATFLGLNASTWWWIIITAIVVLVVVLIWHYSNDDHEH